MFKLKKNSFGEVIKHKARLMAKGYVQCTDIDFDEVCAVVARLDSVRLMLAVAARAGWEVHHLDVKSAFLNGDLDEEVYVSQPPGFVHDGEEQKVLHLHKALYGLRQALHAWNAKLAHTRPNITYVVGYANSFMEVPKTEHMSVVKHLLRYIVGTMTYGLRYAKEIGEVKLTEYSDSDMAGDLDDKKSMIGVLFFLGRSPISWKSQK